jgi:hypothetical protein
MSYGEFSNIKVMDACKQYLERKEKFISKTKEECIQNMMKPRLFGLIKVSREIAIKLLEDNIWHRYNMCEIWSSVDINRVENIKAMAEKADDNKVFLSPDDVSLLKRYL